MRPDVFTQHRYQKTADKDTQWVVALCQKSSLGIALVDVRLRASLWALDQAHRVVTWAGRGLQRAAGAIAWAWLGQAERAELVRQLKGGVRRG